MTLEHAAPWSAGKASLGELSSAESRPSSHATDRREEGSAPCPSVRAQPPASTVSLPMAGWQLSTEARPLTRPGQQDN